MEKFPRVWVRVLLDSPKRMEQIVAEFPGGADYRDRPALFSFEQGVLARLIVGPLEPGVARVFYRRGAPPVGAILELSGGDLSEGIETGTCAPDPAVNREARAIADTMAATFEVITTGPHGTDYEQAKLSRVRRVMALALRLARYATGVVVPDADSGYSSEEFLEDAEDNADMRLIPGRYLLSVCEAHATTGWLQTRGHVLYGLPEVGVYPRAFDSTAALRVVSELARDMMTHGFAPPEGAALELEGERWWVSREGMGVWLASEQDRHYPDAREASRHANYQASFAVLARAHFDATRFAQATTWKEGEPTPRHYVDVSVRPDGMCLMTTCGVGYRARRGVSARKQGCIEIYALVPNDGMRVAMALSALAEAAHAASWWRPFRLFDRMPFPEPIAGIAGLLLVPRHTLRPLRDAPEVVWCMAVPLTAEELDRIRRKTLSGSDLVDEIDRRDGWAAIAERWRAFQPAAEPEN